MIFDEVASSSLVIDPVASLSSQLQSPQQQYVPYRKNVNKSPVLSSSSVGNALPRSSALGSSLISSPVKKEAGTALELLNESLHQFNKTGYGTGENTYRSHWIDKLDAFSSLCTAQPRFATKVMDALKKSAGQIALTEAEVCIHYYCISFPLIVLSYPSSD